MQEHIGKEQLYISSKVRRPYFVARRPRELSAGQPDHACSQSQLYHRRQTAKSSAMAASADDHVLTGHDTVSEPQQDEQECFGIFIHVLYGLGTTKIPEFIRR